MKNLLPLFFLLFCASAWSQNTFELPALGGAPATGDLLRMVDISDTTDSANGSDKKMTILELLTAPRITTSASFGSAGVRLSDDGDGAITFLGLGNGSDEDFTLNLDDTANTIVVSSSTGVTAFDFGSIGITTSGTFSAGTGQVTTFRVLDNVDQSHGLQFVVASDLAANRTLTITTGDANRALTLTGDLVMSGANNLTLTTTGATNVTFPTSGTLATVNGALGTATATTPSVSDSDTSVATTAFVQGERAIVTKSTNTSYTIGTTDSRELYGGVIYVTGAATITAPAVAAGASFTVITVGAVAVSVDVDASDLIVLDGTALSDGDKATNTSTTGDIIVFTYYDATGWYATSNGWTDGN